MLWECPITIIEHNRTALIEADTRSVAIAKIRSNEWLELGDARDYTITKTGACVPAIQTAASAR